MKEIKQKIAWECSKNIRQRQFLSCPADEVLYGGAAGGGKSDSLIMSAIGDNETGFFKNPKWKVLMLRRTFPELERSLILRAKELLYGKAKYDGVKHRFEADGGGMIEFGHVKNDDDKIKYQSAEYTQICFDELTHFTESIYTYLFQRLRTTDTRIQTKIRAASNPGHLGHAWVKKRFIEKKKPMKIYKETLERDGIKTEWSRCFIPATVFDNNYLANRDKYIRTMQELPEIEQKAFLYGDWDIFSGQFFTEFTEDHICEPFEIPKGWPIYISMDWGSSTKCAILFFAEDPETNIVYCFNEIYVSGMAPHLVAGLVKDILAGRVYAGAYADKRISVVNDQTNISTSAVFVEDGLFFEIADHDRINGWHRVRELFMKDRDGLPRFRVFDSCGNFIRTISQQVFSKTNPEDLDTDCEDHLADALRYFAISRKPPAKKESSSSERMVVDPITGYVRFEAEEDDSLMGEYSMKLPRGNWFLDNPKKVVGE